MTYNVLIGTLNLLTH